MVSFCFYTVTDLKEAEDTGSDTDSVISGSNSLLSGSKRSIHTVGAHSGQIISGVKEACRRAFQSQPQRMMCAMYSCNIQATAVVLGELLLRNCCHSTFTFQYSPCYFSFIEQSIVCDNSTNISNYVFCKYLQ